jgi:hypothetical protein
MRRELRVLPRYLSDVSSADGVVAGGVSAASRVGSDIVAPDSAEIYCTEATLRELVERFGLSERGEPNLIVRIPQSPGDQLLDGREAMPVGVVAVDLIEAADVRTRRAGVDLAENLLDQRSRR